MEGKIIKLNKNIFTVKNNDGTLYECLTRGKLRHESISPIVGDNVEINESTKTIEKVLKRKNELIRPQVANIDKLIIVTSTHIPTFSSYLIDKFLVIAYKNNIEPVIVLTKLDKLSFKEKWNIRKYIKYYKKIGIKIYKNTELNKIKNEFKNSTVSLTGQTGAGKSTLLNKIDKDLNLKTDEVSIALGRGKHTTRIVEFIETCGGLVADTPGFSSLELTGITKEEVRDAFVEFGHDCKYSSCMHLKEEGCIVKPKIGNGIEKFRYENYTKLINEVNK